MGPAATVVQKAATIAMEAMMGSFMMIMMKGLFDVLCDERLDGSDEERKGRRRQEMASFIGQLHTPYPVPTGLLTALMRNRDDVLTEHAESTESLPPFSVTSIVYFS